MADWRIYAGSYRRHDGKAIYAVTTAKDADTDEAVVIWTPNAYSGRRAYYTMGKKSFCESVLIGGVRQPKFKRQAQMGIIALAIENFEADGFVHPVRNAAAHTEDGYDDRHRPSAGTYHEYAKQVCKGYRFSRGQACSVCQRGTIHRNIEGGFPRAQEWPALCAKLPENSFERLRQLF